MEKFTSYEKLSKKRKRQLDAARRKDWGAISPVTRRPESPKAYNRKKARKWGDEHTQDRVFFIADTVAEPSQAAGYPRFSQV